MPAGQMGNSEVGHMNIGAGRVVMQDLPKIDEAVKDGSLAKRPAVVNLIDALKKSGGTCHLMGLMSPGGVHSHMNHIIALAKSSAMPAFPLPFMLFWTDATFRPILRWGMSKNLKMPSKA